MAFLYTHYVNQSKELGSTFTRFGTCKTFCSFIINRYVDSNLHFWSLLRQHLYFFYLRGVQFEVFFGIIVCVQ